jgi:hypothetical protein
MKRVARNKASIFAPNGFVPQSPDPNNPANEYVSGWSAHDLENYGFQVTAGLYGLKWLRTSFGLPGVRPQIFGDVLATSTSRLVYRFPRVAHQIVAVHEKSN